MYFCGEHDAPVAFRFVGHHPQPSRLDPDLSVCDMNGRSDEHIADSRNLDHMAKRFRSRSHQQSMPRFLQLTAVWSLAMASLASTAIAATNVRYLGVQLKGAYAVPYLTLKYNSGESSLCVYCGRTSPPNSELVADRSSYGIWDSTLTDGEWVVLDLAAINDIASSSESVDPIQTGRAVWFKFNILNGKSDKSCKGAKTLKYSPTSSNMARLEIAGTLWVPSCDWDKNNSPP